MHNTLTRVCRNVCVSWQVCVPCADCVQSDWDWNVQRSCGGRKGQRRVKRWVHRKLEPYSQSQDKRIVVAIGKLTFSFNFFSSFFVFSSFFLFFFCSCLETTSTMLNSCKLLYSKQLVLSSWQVFFSFLLFFFFFCSFLLFYFLFFFSFFLLFCLEITVQNSCQLSYSEQLVFSSRRVETNTIYLKWCVVHFTVVCCNS